MSDELKILNQNVNGDSVMTDNSVTEIKSENSVSENAFFDNLVWLSTKDAAIYLRKFRKTDGKPSEGAIRTAIWRGLLKARKWGRRLYIKKADLDRMLNNSPLAEGGY